MYYILYITHNIIYYIYYIILSYILYFRVIYFGGVRGQPDFGRGHSEVLLVLVELVMVHPERVSCAQNGGGYETSMTCPKKRRYGELSRTNITKHKDLERHPQCDCDKIQEGICTVINCYVDGMGSSI